MILGRVFVGMEIVITHLTKNINNVFLSFEIIIIFLAIHISNNGEMKGSVHVKCYSYTCDSS